MPPTVQKMVRGEEFSGIFLLESAIVCFNGPSSLPALANERLFELTQRPSLTLAVSLSSAETDMLTRVYYIYEKGMHGYSKDIKDDT